MFSSRPCQSGDRILFALWASAYALLVGGLCLLPFLISYPL